MPPIKNIIQDMKGGIGSISKRSFDVKLSYNRRSRSHSHGVAATSGDENHCKTAADILHESCWANLPYELLRDIIERIEGSEITWPARRNVVVCAGVCRTWREIIKEIVKPPLLSGVLTFPVSLKQPGPKDSPVQCFIKQDRTASAYYLYLGLASKMYALLWRCVTRSTDTTYFGFMDLFWICPRSFMDGDLLEKEMDPEPLK